MASGTWCTLGNARMLYMRKAEAPVLSEPRLIPDRRLAAGPTAGDGGGGGPPTVVPRASVARHTAPN